MVYINMKGDGSNKFRVEMKTWLSAKNTFLRCIEQN